MTKSEYPEFVEFLGHQFTAIDGRFTTIDRRFDAIDQRFLAIDHRFDAIDQRFDTIDEKFREVFGHFDEIGDWIVWSRSIMRSSRRCGGSRVCWPMRLAGARCWSGASKS